MSKTTVLDTFTINFKVFTLHVLYTVHVCMVGGYTVTDSTFNSEELLCTEEEVLDLLQEL